MLLAAGEVREPMVLIPRQHAVDLVAHTVELEVVVILMVLDAIKEKALLALSASSGPARRAPSRQQTQGICK